MLLDPADPNDADLLLVQPNGMIIPRAPKTNLTPADFVDYKVLWRTDGFNYLRASISIMLYRLNEKIFQQGRERVYSDITQDLTLVSKLIEAGTDSKLSDQYIERLFLQILPSAPFALAARCAMSAFQSDQPEIQKIAAVIIRALLGRISDLTKSQAVDWERP